MAPAPPIGSAQHGATVTETIYKICDVALWQASEPAGVFTGAPVDHHDGYIHFSTAAQAFETALRHFNGAEDLVLVAVDALMLGEALRWESSRGGDLFPHLYGPLPLAAVRWTKPLPLGADGRHVFPELVA
ncbi:MAG: dihydroorotate dehydrogenase [Xanthobacteraceae bacterium]|nr:dihydroorotate dehydrogenase [Xanthobacteraceae bacterium]